MTDPVISVVIPVYNREGTIKECIESILKQTYTNFEIIVVDDCSKDKTADVVDDMNDERIRKVIRLPENHGACYARNTGAAAAKGKYIAFQDSDDIWYPEKLEKQFAFIEKNGYDLVFCGMHRQSNINSEKKYFPYYKLDTSDDIQEQLLYENCISTQCILIKKDIFETIKFNETVRRYQDWDFAIRAAEKATIAYQEEAMVYSIVQGNSISSTVSTFNALEVLYKNHYDKIIKNKNTNAHLLQRMGNALRKVEPKKAKIYYKKSLDVKFNLKVFVKYIICIVKQ
ncbi:MAG: glycosyltransferase [Oscillospiraceae bacterium]|nr:glycosyltransferase [Oscillospiraceae bacterium]